MNTSVAEEPNPNAQRIVDMLLVAHDAENLFVRFNEGVSAAARQALHTAAAAVVKRAYRYVDDLYLVEIATTSNLTNALGTYLASNDVLYAAPDYETHETVDPDDAFFDWQWGLKNTRQCIKSYEDPDCEEGAFCNLYPGTADDLDIHATAAWDIWTGDQEFRIAVNDSGINHGHEDLRDNIWTNWLEVSGDGNGDGCPGVCDVDDDGDGLVDEDSAGLQPQEEGYSNDLKDDDDENGYVDDRHGYNTTQDNGDTMDYNGHGSHVAGIIGARGDNGLGVAGVNWRCRLVSLKSSSIKALSSDRLEALEYAIDNDIKVSNNSWSFADGADPENVLAMKDMIAAAEDEIGHIFVASAANNTKNIDETGNEVYPSSWDLDNIISVAATDNNDALAVWNTGGSNWGDISVDLGAPGEAVYSTYDLDGTYRCLSGTSMAAPHVTGAVALVWSKYPTLLWDKVIDRILKSVRGPLLVNETAADGILDLHAALDPSGHDCDGNGTDDLVDTTNNPSIDCNSNSIPDVCEIDGDCHTDSEEDGYGIPDICDIANCVAPAAWCRDCNKNLVPDGCEFVNCNGGTINDACDIADGTSKDCNKNWIPDECDITIVRSLDCNTNGIPDECELDCNTNGVPDGCETLPRVYVDGSRQATGTGVDWANAYGLASGIATAISAAAPGTEIWVKGWVSNYDPITLKDCVSVYGGFDGAESQASESDYKANVTTIVASDQEPSHSQHAVTGIGNNSTAILRGFHIKDSNANGAEDDPDDDKVGGGLYLNFSSPTIVQCVFENNDAIDKGGAVANMGGGSPTFVNCEFKANIDLDASGVLGGGVYTEAGNPQFHNCLFHNNEEVAKGGAAYIASGAPQFINCTISDNTANTSGGGLYDESGTATVLNSILYFNDANGNGDQIHNASSETTVNYSDVKGGWTGTNNLNVNPKFVNRFAGNYALVNDCIRISACIEAGHNSSLPDDMGDLDWNGNYGEQLPNDMDASSDPAVKDKRVWPADVDMG